MSTRITAPVDKAALKTLKAGDAVLLSGTIYSARDAAHKRLIAAIDASAEQSGAALGDTRAIGTPPLSADALPFELSGAVIYHMGPSPTIPGHAIGSAGPTTSGRMNPYTPTLVRLGLGAIIGKGKLDEASRLAIAEHGAVYFAAVGGAGALLSRCVTSSEVIAYDDLGAEAIRRLTVRDFPAVVVIDSRGTDLYETGPRDFLAAAAESGDSVNASGDACRAARSRP